MTKQKLRGGEKKRGAEVRGYSFNGDFMTEVDIEQEKLSLFFHLIE